MSYPIVGEYSQGLVVYYEDNNNFIVAYAQYFQDAPNRLREIQITGKIGGVDLGWHDFWADNFTIDPQAEMTLSVKKEGSKFSPYLNGQAIGYWYADGDYRYSIDLSDTAKYSSEITGHDYSNKSMVGFYFNTQSTHTVTYNDVIVDKIY